MMIAKRLVFVGVVLVAVLVLSVPAMAANQIAQVSKFTGEAYIVSPAAGKVKVHRIGQPLNNGDKIMVQDGEVEFVYTDGAMTTVSKNTQAVVTEQEEQSSLWFMKNKRLTRRIKTFIGRIFHQSGSSVKYHIAETPTAVAAIRGSAWTVTVVQYTDPASGQLVTRAFVAGQRGSGFAVVNTEGSGLAVVSEGSMEALPEDATIVAQFTVNTPNTIPGQNTTPANTRTEVTTQQQTVEDFVENIEEQVQEQQELQRLDPQIVAQVQEDVVEQIIDIISPSQ